MAADRPSQPLIDLVDQNEAGQDIIHAMAQTNRKYLQQPLHRFFLSLAKPLDQLKVNLFGRPAKVFTAQQMIALRMFFLFPIGFTLKFGLFWAATCLTVAHNLLDYWDDALIALENKTADENFVRANFLHKVATRLVHITLLWTIWISTYNTTLEAGAQFLLSMALLLVELGRTAFDVANHFRSARTTPLTQSSKDEFITHLESWSIALLISAQTEFYPLFSWSGFFSLAAFVICLLHHSNELAQEQRQGLKGKEDKGSVEEGHHVPHPPRSYAEAVRAPGAAMDR